MVKSKVTGKEYDPTQAVYITNPVQTYQYLKNIGPEYFLDILWDSERKPDALVYVWMKCDETKKCKLLWDQHLLESF